MQHFSNWLPSSVNLAWKMQSFQIGWLLDDSSRIELVETWRLELRFLQNQHPRNILLTWPEQLTLSPMLDPFATGLAWISMQHYRARWKKKKFGLIIFVWIITIPKKLTLKAAAGSDFNNCCSVWKGCDISETSYKITPNENQHNRHTFYTVHAYSILKTTELY